MREKLIELLTHDDCPLLYVLGENVGSLADYLIANGVTIPVRCKDCSLCYYNSSNETLKCTSMNGMYRTVETDDFCSYGERKDNG